MGVGVLWLLLYANTPTGIPGILAYNTGYIDGVLVRNMLPGIVLGTTALGSSLVLGTGCRVVPGTGRWYWWCWISGGGEVCSRLYTSAYEYEQPF